MEYFSSNIDDFLEGFLNNRFNITPITIKPTKIDYSKQPKEGYELNLTKDGAYLLFDVPGFNKSNLKVYSEDGMLAIEGTRFYKLNGEEVSKSINKKISIGENYNPETIEATIDDGILTVFIPNFKKREKKRINLI